MIFIDVPYPAIERRIFDIKSRGVVIEKGKSLMDLYTERRPLYQQYADVTVNADGKSMEELVARIAELVGDSKV